MGTQGVERKLAAIVSTDIVGYSRLMGADEAGTLARMKAHRAELWSPLIKKYGGRIVGTAGDSLLVEYASAVAAVESAIEMQDGMTAREAEVPEEQKMRLRIGINVGEVIVDGDDIFGDGVNIAARLQAIAAPGGICISEDVQRQTGGRIEAHFEDGGAQEVKNIARPVTVFHWGAAPSAGEATTSTSPAGAGEKPSIAVLPFDNLSNDPEQDYFADGLAEDLITELSRDPDLLVIARNSSFAYKGQSPDIRQVAKELGVRYVLEGSVRRAGNRIRLNAQLIEAESNHHVWAERYDRALEDIFDVQDELTLLIGNTLLRRVTQIAQEQSLRQRPADMGAYDHAMRGFALLLRLGEGDLDEAKRHAEAAIALDPDYARGHVSLGMFHVFHAISGSADDPRHELELAREAANRAIALDPNDVWSHLALGFAETWSGRPERAMTALDRALVLSPNFADAHGMRAVALNYLGRPDEGVQAIELAIRLNPRYPDWYAQTIARSFYLLGRHEDAIPYLSKLSSTGSQMVPARVLAVANYVALERLEEAREEAVAVLKIVPDMTATRAASVIPFHTEEERAHYRDRLRKAGLPE